MNSFFPVGASSLTATEGIGKLLRIPDGGPILVVRRQTSISRVFIKFGNSSTVYSSPSDMVELVSGVIEEFENPNPSQYSHLMVTAGAGSADCMVNVMAGPRYRITKRKGKR